MDERQDEKTQQQQQEQSVMCMHRKAKQGEREKRDRIHKENTNGKRKQIEFHLSTWTMACDERVAVNSVRGRKMMQLAVVKTR